MKHMLKTFCLLLVFALLFAGAPSGLEPGDMAHNFTLKNVDGKNISLSDYKDRKGIILIFDCNTCPYSKMYNERIQALDKNFKSKGFPVVAINSNNGEVSPGDSYENMMKQAKSKGYTFPYLYDESGEVAKAYGATNTPHVFLLKREGSEFTVAYIGAIDNNTQDASAATKKYVESSIDELLQGKPVTTTKTKAIGCTIKFKKS
jgi:peroxiredoxin